MKLNVSRVLDEGEEDEEEEGCPLEAKAHKSTTWVPEGLEILRVWAGWRWTDKAERGGMVVKDIGAGCRVRSG